MVSSTLQSWVWILLRKFTSIPAKTFITIAWLSNYDRLVIAQIMCQGWYKKALSDVIEDTRIPDFLPLVLLCHLYKSLAMAKQLPVAEKPVLFQQLGTRDPARRPDAFGQDHRCRRWLVQHLLLRDWSWKTRSEVWVPFFYLWTSSCSDDNYNHPLWLNLGQIGERKS